MDTSEIPTNVFGVRNELKPLGNVFLDAVFAWQLAQIAYRSPRTHVQMIGEF